MTLETYLAYLLTVAVFFATPPGTSQLLMISNSLRHGLRASTATIAGDLTANALQMTAAAFGLAVLIASSQAALGIIKWLGVLYLLWIGLRTFRAAPPDLTRKVPHVPRARLFRQGFLTSGTNPEAVFFFAALFPQFIDAGAPITPQLIALAATYLVIDGLILVAMGGLAERLLARLRRRGRLLNRLSGGLMMAAAGLLAFKDADVRVKG